MDLKIVGAGRLGCRVGCLWKEKFPESKIYFKTRSDNTDRSTKWVSSGFIPLCEKDDLDPVRAEYVVFCAPPSNNPSYAENVKTSVSRDWKAESGMFVFTGSGSVYAENCGQTIDEKSPVKNDTDRALILLKSESAVIENGGVVLRFGGLYESCSQLMNFWLGIEEAKTVNSCPNGLINLIHYDDAARCIISALLNISNNDPNLFLVSDGVPMSRQQICKAALSCPKYQDRKLPLFQGDVSLVDGKKYQTELVRNTLKWEPNFKSFAEFMASSYDKELDVGHII